MDTDRPGWGLWIAAIAVPWAAFVIGVAFSDWLRVPSSLFDTVGTSLLLYSALAISSGLLLRGRRRAVALVASFGLPLAVWGLAVLLPPSRGSLMMGPISPADVLRMPGGIVVEGIGALTGDSGERRRARLIRAAEQGDLQVLGGAALPELTRGIPGGRSVLFAAARAGSLPSVQHIVERGADIGPEADAMLGAAVGGDAAVARWLVDHGAEPAIPPERCGGAQFHEPDPVQVAIEDGHVEVAEILFAPGLERWSTMYADALLEHAVCARDASLVGFAVDHGADPAIPNRGGATLLEMAVVRIDLYGRDSTRQRDRALVDALVDVGLDPDAPTSTSITARELAASADLPWLFGL